MASLTFAQAKILFAPFISSIGPTDPLVPTAINFVNEKFISGGQWRGNRFIYSFSVSVDSNGNNYFDTIPGIDTVLRVLAVDNQNINGELGNVMSDWFPWENGSLGWLAPTYAGDLQLVRLGNSPVYPLPSGNGAGSYTSDTQRYRVIGAVPEVRTMYCLVRRAYVQLVNDNDLLIPSNINAYRYGLQAYVYENNNELERAKVYWDLAYDSLNNDTQSFEDSEEASIQIQTKTFAPGLLQNLI
jgi:hypothetical protein